MADYTSRYTGPQIDEGIGKANDAVLTTPQELGEEQKQIARGNIGAGDYSQPEGGIPETDLAAALRNKINGKLDKAVGFDVPYEKYLIIPAGMYNLAMMVGHEDNNYQPIFVTGENTEIFKVATLDNRELPFDIMLGRTDDAAVLALRNNLSDDIIPAFVKVLLLAGDMPKINVGTASDFDDEPKLLTDVRNLYTKPSNGIPALDMASEVQTSLGKADAALQPVSGATNGNLAGLNSQGKVVDSGKKPSDFAAANLVPAQASPSNQLADKNFVNSSIQTATATFRGNWDSFDDIPTNSSGLPGEEADNNDYLVVRNAGDYADSYDEVVVYYAETEEIPQGTVVADGTWVEHGMSGFKRYIAVQNINLNEITPRPSEDTEHTYWGPYSGGNPAYEGTWRFKYVPNGSGYNKYNWRPEYQVNEKPLTAAQLAALNSNITAAKVAKLDALPSASELQTSLGAKENTSNKVTSLSAQSTDTQYPSAKCVYNILGDVESLINAL